MLFTLIKNEIIKLMHRKKTYVVIGAFVLLLGFIGFGTYKNCEHMKESSKPENRIAMEQDQIKNLQEMKKDTTIPERDKKEFDNQIKECSKNIEEIKKEIKSGKSDWKQELIKHNKELEQQLKDPNTESRGKEGIKLEVQKNKYLLSHNIVPKHNNIEIRATDYIIDVFALLGAIFLCVGIIVFGTDMVSGEYTPPTMKFLLTEPVSRGKILFSKFITLIVSSVVLIVGIEILAFVVMGLIFNFGDFNYPVQVGTKYVYDLIAKPEMGRKVITIVAGSTSIITMGKYILYMFLVQIIFIIACSAFTFLLSTALKSSMVSMSLSIVLVIAFNIFANFSALSKISGFLFTTFGEPGSILSGDIMGRYGNIHLTPTFAIGVLVTWTIICYIISHIVFTKKDILI
ncbi:ABC transporter permease subunit [Clostridium botulinum]|uniref:ABC transporter permease n=1 Tax=Clostridium botulinum TaxID=1491 RepID=A0A9Q1V0C5_CLOBO|nr:ABC transporter permease subunit [Clostridium botulinum]AEB76663.1 ABC transporter, permease protein, putative [Clostridium botulinum BKT015925]KEI01317.1 ABC transporter permease [Clostridium botulinum C/D str. Sp77]KEI02922.1 ABC transporter permease [Clostridium botulinum D str. 16868]KLU76901.1 ABC transporter permease [Clostridium botulinum V891]KOA73079.1 ABC transporter permease [Clostridium botulinum]